MSITIEHDQSLQLQSLIDQIGLHKKSIEFFDTQKQEAETALKELLNHNNDDGSKSYKFNELYNIKITTGYNYTLDKKQYAAIKDNINPQFNPVKEVSKLELNKKTLRDCCEFGSPEDVYNQSQFITSTLKKLHVSIEKIKKDTKSSPDFE